VPSGEGDYPLGTLETLDRVLAAKKGLETFRFTVDRVRNTARMVLRDGPDAVRRAGIDALLVDEADMGGSVAAACRLQDAIRRIDGLDEAANIIESALKIELSAPA
jgi:hypothetical protein